MTTALLLAPGSWLPAATPIATASGGGAAVSGSQIRSCGPIPDLHHREFPNSPRVDNRFQPLIPGVQVVLDGFVTGSDGRHHPHRIVSTVTDLTKLVDGVRTVVVFELDFQDGRLIESELFFAAQDLGGTVWHVGEYPEIYVRGRLVGAPDTWLSGADRARAGIDMPAEPRVGVAFTQGFSPRIRFWDCAQVVKSDLRTCVPAGCFEDAILTNEWAPFDPTGGHQHKFIAGGLRTIRAQDFGGSGPESLTLTSSAALCSSAFAAVRQQAQEQDVRGYRVAPHVYGQAPPATRTLHARTC